MNEFEEDKILFLATGVLSVSVCAPKDMSQSEILRQVEVAYPSGTTCGWHFSNNTHFKSGKEIPNQCELYDDRQHWYIVV